MPAIGTLVVPFLDGVLQPPQRDVETFTRRAEHGEGSKLHGWRCEDSQLVSESYYTDVSAAAAGRTAHAALVGQVVTVDHFGGPYANCEVMRPLKLDQFRVSGFRFIGGVLYRFPVVIRATWRIRQQWIGGS